MMERVTDRAVAVDGPVKTMSAPAFRAAEPSEASDEPAKPAVLRMGTLRLFDAVKGQTRFLSPLAQFLFLASCILLLLAPPLLLAVGTLGAPVRLEEPASLVGSGLVLLCTMLALYLLGRRSEKRRASDAFGKQVDRRPRF